MKHIQLLSLLSVAVAAVAFAGCGGKGDDKDNETTQNNLLPADIANALGPSNPPTLGRRIDRAGRPAIGAALIERFNPDADAQKKANADYNAAGIGDPQFFPTIRASLAILDGLDGKCGNQLLAAKEGDRYAPLATALLDDQLYINSNNGKGSVYLGVEAEAIGAVGPGQGLGGGRVPGDDVIARSYSVLAAGALSGIDDGVTGDDQTHDPNNFPFIAAPH